jgi:hypothetical protein
VSIGDIKPHWRNTRRSPPRVSGGLSRPAPQVQLAVLTPRSRINHGVLAPHAAWRARVVAFGAPVEAPVGAGASANGTEDSAAPRSRDWAWADLMRRAFDVDVLACPRWGGRLRLIATVEALTRSARSWPRSRCRESRRTSAAVCRVAGHEPRRSADAEACSLASWGGPLPGQAGSLRDRNPLTGRCPRCIRWAERSVDELRTAWRGRSCREGAFIQVIPANSNNVSCALFRLIATWSFFAMNFAVLLSRARVVAPTRVAYHLRSLCNRKFS